MFFQPSAFRSSTPAPLHSGQGRYGLLQLAMHACLRLLGALILFGCTAQVGCTAQLDKVQATASAVTEPTSSGPSLPLACSNGKLDPSETAIDCGGPSCPPCGRDMGCVRDSDCASRLCRDKKCVGQSCDNGVKDSGEGDTDCGGLCAPCADGRACAVNAHCASGSCIDNFCEKPSCEDKSQNGDETDLNCGGTCPACADGSVCKVNTDCASSYCVDKVCVDKRCKDNQQNGSESDKDCGGTCAACKPGLHCLGDADCDSAHCVSTGDALVCAEPTCDDSYRNGTESDIDCGGSCSTKCADGARCLKPEDCVSASCQADPDNVMLLHCAAPTCSDGIQNGGEAGNDCAGPCKTLCKLDDKCGKDADCASGRCDGTCKATACDDGRKNGGETGVDCGGSCPAGCGLGAPCAAPKDCASQRCDKTCLPGTTDTPCGSKEGCISGRCSMSGKCEAGHAMDPCTAGPDCVSKSCVSNLCAAGPVGSTCFADADCNSGDCRSTCRAGGMGQSCGGNLDCFTGSCNSGACAKLAGVSLTRVDDGPPAGNNDRVSIHLTLATPAKIAINDLALLYYFTVDRVYPITGAWEYSAPMGARYIYNLGGMDRLLMYHNPSLNLTSSAALSINVQLEGPNASGLFDKVDDPSYKDINAIIVCRNDAGRWKRIYGVSPRADDPDPCARVVTKCPATGIERCVEATADH